MQSSETGLFLHVPPNIIAVCSFLWYWSSINLTFVPESNFDICDSCVTYLLTHIQVEMKR